MKKPTGHIIGNRSQNIRKNLNRLQQIIRANPGIEFHRGGFIPGKLTVRTKSVAADEGKQEEAQILNRKIAWHR